MRKQKPNHPVAPFAGLWLIIIIAAIIFTQSGDHGQITGWLSSRI